MVSRGLGKISEKGEDRSPREPHTLRFIESNCQPSDKYAKVEREPFNLFQKTTLDKT